MSSTIIVDDDSDSVAALHRFLDLSDIHVLGEGADGKDAVKLYEKYNPDFVLLDLAMPKFDGYYAIENIKKINQDAKIIVLTRSTSDADEDKLELLKPFAVFTKPYEVRKLAIMIKDSR